MQQDARPNNVERLQDFRSDLFAATARAGQPRHERAAVAREDATQRQDGRRQVQQAEGDLFNIGLDRFAMIVDGVDERHDLGSDARRQARDGRAALGDLRPDDGRAVAGVAQPVQGLEQARDPGDRGRGVALARRFIR